VVVDKSYYLETGFMCKIQLPKWCEQIAMQNVPHFKIKGIHLLIKLRPSLVSHSEFSQYCHIGLAICNILGHLCSMLAGITSSAYVRAGSPSLPWSRT